MKHCILLAFFLLSKICLQGQVPHWGFKLGGALTDEAYICKAAPNGNIYISGKFSGTIDIDPGPVVQNITSSGPSDAYLACYDSIGNFQWGFGIGGTLYDGAYGITVDKITSDVYICGFYQVSMDCDPGPGVAMLISAGGTGLTSVGDGFIAKYSSTGAYQWAKSLGGPTVYDHAESLETDLAGNVYVGGEFNTSMTIAPGVTFSSAASGPGYIIKYSPAGSLIWGHNFGQAGIPGLVTVPRTLVVSNGYINVCGLFKGTANFNPWGSTPATVTASGGFTGIDGFISKYDTAGNFVFLQTVSGAALDDMTSLTLDASDNIYVTGYSASNSLIFDAASPSTSTVAPPVGAGGNNITIAKYSSTGAYQWGKIVGGPGDDEGRLGTSRLGSHIIITGWFSNTVDFDPSPSSASLTSAGGADIFVARYDFAGNYVCAFGLGSSYASNHGCMMSPDASGNLYLCGQFGATVDFDPTSATFPLTSAGSGDAFLVKYRFSDTTFTGSLVGGNICIGDTAYLSIIISSGPAGPYTLTISDGSSSFTVSGVMSGTPFMISPSLSTGAVYTVTAAAFTGGVCGVSTGTITGTATITVTAPPSAITGNAPICVGSSLLLSSTTPGGTWSVSPLSVANISSTGLLTAIAAGTATVLYTNTCGSTSAVVSINALPGPILGNTPICPGSGIALANAAPGGTWSCAPSSVATISSAGFVTGISPGTAIVTYSALCGTVFTVVTVNSSGASISGSTPICTGDTVSLISSPTGGTWSVTPASVAAVSSSGTVTGIATGTAVVSYISTCGAASVIVTVSSSPVAIMGNTPLCIGSTISLSNASPGGAWSCAPLSIATISPTGTIEGIAAGTAIVTYTTSCGSVTNEITVNQAPVPYLGPDIAICPGLRMRILPSGVNGSTLYLWSTGQTSSSISVDSPGTYWLLVKENGCDASDTINVTFKSAPTVELGADTTLCTSEGIVIGVIAEMQTTYHWNTGGTGPTITAITSGTYVLTATKNGCTKSDSRTVTIIPGPPSLSLGPDTSLCLDETLHLSTGQDSTLWSTGKTGESITISNPGTYWATIANVCGIVTDTIVIRDENCDIWFPSGFTPNGDGLNDIARVRGNLMISDFNLSIYNRWGERVFFTHSISDGWNGYFRNQAADVGVYYYMIRYTRKGKANLLKGDLTLIR
ncbi:MAG: gliding motility-associated C-terminal domain-containing protein [Taibaiella sp.]|nr:gliding motility-associated C-terminal domain-containing protein [Taibaiella sp.]